MAKVNEEKVQLALDEHKWIYTPVVYTTRGQTFKRFQQDVMNRVMGKLQNHINQYLDEERYKDPETPKSMFSEEVLARGIEPIRLTLSEFSLGSSHYGSADEMLEPLRDLCVYAPAFDKETGLKKGMDYIPIFKKIFIPESSVSNEGEEYKYSGSYIDENGNEILPTRKDGYVDVTINDEVAKYAFAMDHGYFSHLERIALFCNSAYTSRLYLLLMRYVSKGNMHPAIDYREIKDFLGMFVRKERSVEIITEKFEKFSQFRKQVLDVARRDMDRLCVENKIEIQLATTPQCKDGYEPLYSGSKKRGNPEKIKFHIKRTPLGVARELELHRGSSEERLVNKFLELYPTLDEMELREFISSVPDDIWSEFKKYAYNAVPKAVEQPHRWDGSPESFIMYIMKQWVEQKTRVVPMQMEMFANEAEAVEVKPKELLPGEAEWNKFLQLYDGFVVSRLKGMSFRKFEGGVVYINATRGQKISFARILSAHPEEKEILRAKLNEAYGAEVKISY
ncbi:MAG: replication initiation protein [Prevotellaceae bacterium]|nr:replication initiation protein [Prevotellaceae bacterium]